MLTREDCSNLIRRDLPGIFSLCHKKKVAVIGNAISAFKKQGIIEEINKNDVVVRCNKGIAHKILGKRCEIYCAAGSGLARKSQYRTDLPKEKVWMTDKNHPAKPKDFLFFPIKARQNLISEIGLVSGEKPTTGSMAIYMVLLCNLARISLFGFDFWETKSFHSRKNLAGEEHRPGLEKSWVEKQEEIQVF